MNSTFVKLNPLVLLLVPTLVIAQNENVQEEGDTSFSVLEEIIVTGEVQSRSVQDTSTSVSVFSQNKIEESTDNNIYDIIKRSANAGGVDGNKGFSIRGIEQSGADGAGLGRTIDINVDGASLPSRQSTFFGPYTAWDLQQVEILRGPQSTQQGRNALAGSVSIRTADPHFEQETKIRLRAGELGETNLALSHNQPLNDEWAVRLALEKHNFDGTVENPTRDDDNYDERDLSLVRGKILFEPSDDLLVVFGHSYTDTSGGEDIISRSFFPDKRVNFSDHEAFEGSKHNITGLKVDYIINDSWSLNSETTHYKHDYTRVEDFDNTAFAGSFIDRDINDTSLSQEFKFIYDNGTQFRGAFGLFATTIEANWDGDIVSDASLLDPRVPAGAALFSQNLQETTETDNIAVYGELEYDLSDKWQVIAGARYDYENIKVDSITSNSLEPAIAPIPGDETSVTETSFNAFLPKIGIKYIFNNKVNTAFTIQQGYRAGGSDINPLTLEVNRYDPEFTTNYELSVRSQFLNDRIKLNGNLFFTDWEDQQVIAFGDSGNINDRFTANAGSSQVYGAELELEFAANEKLSMYSSIGYSKTEFLEFNSQGTDFAGNEFSNSPELTINLGGKYAFNNHWSLQLDGNFKDEFYTNIDNSEETEVNSRFVVDAKLEYEAKKWSANLYARNVLDKEYLEFANGDEVRTGDPRIAGLELNLKF